MMKPLAATAGALLIVSANAVQAKPHHRHSLPLSVRLTLAGVSLDDAWDGRILYDPKSHYYLVEASSESHSGAELTLTPDIEDQISPEGTESNTEFKRRMQSEAHHASFSHLRDGYGINIGATPQQVRRQLGLPTIQSGTRGEQDYTYKVTYQGERYKETYSFHNNRVWSIDYGRDSIYE